MIVFQHSPFEWRPPKRKWWFFPVVFLRVLWLLLITFGLLIPFVIVRFAKKIFVNFFFGRAMPSSHQLEYTIYRCWGRLSWLSFPIRPIVHGKPMKGGGAVVSNHSSWLDIPILLGTIGGYMVAKSEVRTWFAIGAIARLIGTEFVDRKRSSSRRQTTSLKNRMISGGRLVFFPEGTSTDGLVVTKFRSTLFASLVSADPKSFVQPVSIVYHAPKNASVNFFGWWGDMKLAPNMLAVMALPRRVNVDVVFHEPIEIGTDRKALCALCEEASVSGFIKYSDKIESRQ